MVLVDGYRLNSTSPWGCWENPKALRKAGYIYIGFNRVEGFRVYGFVILGVWGLGFRVVEGLAFWITEPLYHQKDF